MEEERLSAPPDFLYHPEGKFQKRKRGERENYQGSPFSLSTEKNKKIQRMGREKQSATKKKGKQGRIDRKTEVFREEREERLHGNNEAAAMGEYNERQFLVGEGGIVMIQCFLRKECSKPGVVRLADDNIFGEQRGWKGINGVRSQAVWSDIERDIISLFERR